MEKYHPAHIISRNGTNSPKNSPLGPFLSHYLCFRILSTIYFGYFYYLYGEQCQIMNNICTIGTQLCATNMYFELSNFFFILFPEPALDWHQKEPIYNLNRGVDQGHAPVPLAERPVKLRPVNIARPARATRRPES